MRHKRFRIMFLVGGYPSSENPSHGIFNQRAAHAISPFVDLTVVQFRLLKPGRKIIERIQENGFTRFILCVPYIPLLQLFFYELNNWIFASFNHFFLGKIIKQQDIVHAGDGNTSVFASRLKKKYSFFLLAQFIGSDLYQELHSKRNAKWVSKWLDNLDAVAFNSKALQNYFNDVFEPCSISKVIYRGVNLSVFRPNSDSIKGFKFYFIGGLPNYSTSSYGRNTKGGINLMEAWKIIDNNPFYDKLEISLDFAGPDSDDVMARRWRDKLRIPSRVKLHGKINPRDIPEFHRSFNIALIPSLEEGLPNAAMEAAATANLILSTRVGGIPEVLTHKVNALLCDDTTIESLLENMEYILKNPDCIVDFGKTAHLTVQQHFDSNNFGQSYFDLYNKIVSKI